jgi:hypothetical protein
LQAEPPTREGGRLSGMRHSQSKHCTEIGAKNIFSYIKVNPFVILSLKQTGHIKNNLIFDDEKNVRYIYRERRGMKLYPQQGIAPKER